ADTLTIKITLNDKGRPSRQTRGRGVALHRQLAARRSETDRLQHLGAPRRQRSQRHISCTQLQRDGERRSYALLRPIGDVTSQDRIRELILEAFAAFEERTVIAS